MSKPVLVSALRAACLLLGLALSGSAGADDDHERAHQARQAGKIRPLSDVLAQVAQQGQVLEVELEHEHAQWRYEIKVLTPEGRVRKLLIDASPSSTAKPTIRKAP